MDTIGKRLINALENKNMTQRALANSVGVSEVAISRYIHGKREPKGEIISRMASVLEVSADYLLGRTKDSRLPEVKLREDNEDYSIDLSGLSPEGLRKVKDYVEYIKQKDKADPT